MSSSDYYILFLQAKTGFMLNIIGILCINLGINTWGGAMFNLDTFPDWANTTASGPWICLQPVKKLIQFYCHTRRHWTKYHIFQLLLQTNEEKAQKSIVWGKTFLTLVDNSLLLLQDTITHTGKLQKNVFRPFKKKKKKVVAEFFHSHWSQISKRLNDSLNLVIERAIKDFHL